MQGHPADDVADGFGQGLIEPRHDVVEKGRQLPAGPAAGHDHRHRVVLAHAPYNGPRVWHLRGHLGGRPEDLAVGAPPSRDLAGARVVAPQRLHGVDYAVGPELQAAVGPSLVPALGVRARLPDLPAVKTDAVHGTGGVLEDERVALLRDDRVVVPDHVVGCVVPQELAGGRVCAHHLASASSRGRVRSEGDKPVVRGQRANVIAYRSAVALGVAPRAMRLLPIAHMLRPPR
mmetsp:Transcript_142417/g.442851  ORF Transcript_142417/g.442851 Transcript_142417/m.442851 type:complete len:232 (-) Transcript_142417:231-926(-)